jgi:peptide/nickel transport system substrate-binding protein
MIPRVAAPSRMIPRIGACAVAAWLALSVGAAADARAPGRLAARQFKSPLTESPAGRRGGVLDVLDETDFEHLDPGNAYYSLDYEVVYATQRPLYSFRPNGFTAVPDLAAGPPLISPDGRTVTVRIRRGVRFSPPVDREVTSHDVAYAIERGANPHVANPYIDAYFGSIEGMAQADGGPIPGIVTPNAHEIAFHLTEPLGRVVADSLVLPLTAPVPEGYAARFDRHEPSDYAAHEVATGPYMFRNDRSGRVLGVGYRPGRAATLVRNPNWRRRTDIRPAYLNAIHIRIGDSNNVIGPRVLSGRDIIENEPSNQFAVDDAERRHPAQVEVSPGAGDHYIGLNSARGPFRDINLRKALWAALDRRGLELARGDSPEAPVASHFLYPTIPGFEAAGGLEGPHGAQFDFDEHPEGSLDVAFKYMRLAGYSDRYTGSEVVSIVGARGEPAEADAKLVDETVEKLGFKTDFKLVETATMFSSYCNVAATQPDICPSVGWIADFGDAQTVLDPTFNGNLIDATGNVNWGQTNVPVINAAMFAAERIDDPAARALAWAKIDDELVEDAADIPFGWDSQANIEGSGVHGVGDLWNTGSWDYSWTSLR